MWYHLYEAQTQALAPLREAARLALRMKPGMNGAADTPAGRHLLAVLEMTTRTRLTHARPDFGITEVMVDGKAARVREQTVRALPFGNLVHFRKDIEAPQPRVILVAPLSGHFSTLLRNTVQTLLQDHEVYLTDWTNARDVGLEHGRFGFEDYVDYLIDFLEFLGPGAHMVAVCQPCAQALVAASVMAARNHPCEPRSITLMAGPVDCRINPTEVNRLATENPIEWFRANLISTVPFPLRGWGRRVYPGFMQLTAFVSMNPQRHLDAHQDLYRMLASGDEAGARKIKDFYDEYFAVLDLSAEFYLETVQWVFQDMRIPTGRMMHRGEIVDPSAIRRPALLTVEGERDDICSVGQTAAAHDLTPKLRPHLRHHHLQPGVGHYGVFSGKKWESQIYPKVRSVILSME
jgi:poly(3-hydroxybutyrate) depolymerase